MSTTDVQPAALAADAFFTASAAGDAEGMRAAAADGAVFWQNTDGVERTIAQIIRHVARLRAGGDFSYVDVRRLVAPGGFCEQHTVRFHDADGTTTREIPVCAVGRIDTAGRITRLDEYVDSSPRDDRTTLNPNDMEVVP